MRLRHIFFAACLLGTSAANSAFAVEHPSLVIVVAHAKGKATYEFDKRKRSLRELFEALEPYSIPSSDNRNVFIIFDEGTKLVDVFNLRQALYPMQVGNVRIFQVGKSKEKMIEIYRASKAIPFTTSVDILDKITPEGEW